MPIQWRPIAGLEERYDVSNTGLVRSKMHRFGVRSTPLILAQRMSGNKKGRQYIQYRLYAGDGFCIYEKAHRLVAKAFLPNPNNLPLVNHIDEVKLNNIHSNLEWCTSQENNEHSLKGEYKFLSPEGILFEVKNISRHCREHGLSDSNLNRVHTGQRTQHKGWKKA